MVSLRILKMTWTHWWNIVIHQGYLELPPTVLKLIVLVCEWLSFKFNLATVWQPRQKFGEEQPKDILRIMQSYLDSTFARDLYKFKARWIVSKWRKGVDIHNKNMLRRLSVGPLKIPPLVLWFYPNHDSWQQYNLPRNTISMDYGLTIDYSENDVAHNLPRWTWAKHGLSSAGDPCSLQLRGDALGYGKICGVIRSTFYFLMQWFFNWKKT